jgi:hypothetical protein
MWDSITEAYRLAHQTPATSAEVICCLIVLVYISMGVRKLQGQVSELKSQIDKIQKSK